MAVSDTNKFELTLNTIHKCGFEWVIRKFVDQQNDVTSPEFCVANDCTAKYKAIMELRNLKRAKKIKLKLKISNSSSITMEVKFCYKIYFGAIMIADETLEYLAPYNILICGEEIDWLQVFTRIRSSEFVTEDNNLEFDDIKIVAHIVVNNCCQTKEYNEEQNSNSLIHLQIDFKSSWKNQQFTDVVLNVEDEIVPAHKFVLCSRSPVFRQMFDVSFKESTDNSIIIEDMEKSVLEIFLEFLYTGVLVDYSFNTVADLYSAADKYEVISLQTICREALVTHISENTVTIILKLADMHNDDSLKEKAIAYICHNFDKVEQTTEWDQLLESDFKLTSYALRRVARKLRN